MNLIHQISNDTLQKHTIILDDGSSFQITFCFKPMQFGWFIQELTYGGFILRGMRLVTSPNILHQFLHQIPFGIGCFNIANLEPTHQDDFSSGNFQLYLLDHAETLEYAELLSGQVRS